MAGATTAPRRAPASTSCACAGPAGRTRGAWSSWSNDAPGGSRLSRRSAPFEPRAGAGLARAPVDGVGGGQVLDRHAERFVDGHVVARRAPGDVTQPDLADLAQEVGFLDRAVLLREQEIPRLVAARLPAVRVEARAPHRVAVELAAAGEARPDGVHVRARREPRAAHHRLPGRGGRAHER